MLRFWHRWWTEGNWSWWNVPGGLFSLMWKERSISVKQSCLAVSELQAGAVALIKERTTVVRVAESHSFSWKGWDERKTYSITFDNVIQFPTASEKNTPKEIFYGWHAVSFTFFNVLAHYSTNNRIVLLCNWKSLEYIICWFNNLKF